MIHAVRTEKCDENTNKRKSMTQTWLQLKELRVREDNRVQCRHFIPALNVWATRAYYTTAHPDCHPFPWVWMQPQVPDLTTERTFDPQETWVIADGLDLCFDMLSMGIYTKVRSTDAGITCLYCNSDKV